MIRNLWLKFRNWLAQFFIRSSVKDKVILRNSNDEGSSQPGNGTEVKIENHDLSDGQDHGIIGGHASR